MTTITVPQGDIVLATDDWMSDTSPEAVRYDVAVLALAFADARHRADPSEENTLRLVAAQTTFTEAEDAMFPPAHQE